jgi:hypothetical protein
MMNGKEFQKGFPIHNQHGIWNEDILSYAAVWHETTKNRPGLGSAEVPNGSQSSARFSTERHGVCEVQRV